MNLHENKLINEIEELRSSFHVMTEKLVKDIKRQDKIMFRSDKRQRQEYDELQLKLHQVEKLQIAQKDLLDSFIYLMASAIDEKSTHTGAHCTRVPELSLMIVDVANDCNEGIFKEFKIENEDQRREISIASWLHDCGKVTTPEYVVDKATKLETITNRIHEVRTRFEVIHRDKTIEALNKKLNGEDASSVDLWLECEHTRLQNEFKILADANIGSEYMDDNVKDDIKKISTQTWIRNFDDSLGLASEEQKRVLSESNTTPQIEKLLDDKLRHIIPRENFDYEEYESMGFKTPVPDHLYNFGEVYNLTISAGTLSYEERFKIQEHVHMTIKMLEKLPFPEHLKNVPLYAGAHHETLIGTGYPRKLSVEDMPIASRIMAIADIFEALTASDRPYKVAKTLSQSIDIMASMVKRQHIDRDIFQLFLKNDLHILYAKKYLDEKQIDIVDISQYL
jgi:HD-GYP domain-containing protein (c-di-GMP phosphodiesterase class II)